MFRVQGLLPDDRTRAPRRCGGVPPNPGSATRACGCSPQVRGCSDGDYPIKACDKVLPAGAGVFRRRRLTRSRWRRAPRRCGGVPDGAAGATYAFACSPQVRGCSGWAFYRTVPELVLPAGAGVFRRTSASTSRSTSAPRRRGGVPTTKTSNPDACWCSPQARGCPPTRSRPAVRRRKSRPSRSSWSGWAVSRTRALPGRAGRDCAEPMCGGGVRNAIRTSRNCAVPWGCRGGTAETCPPRGAGGAVGALGFDEGRY